MSTKLLIIIFTLNLFTSLCQQDYEVIEEYIPYIVYFQTVNANSYKIYNYTPSCDNIYTKKVYINLMKDEYTYIKLYTYYDASKIEQDSEGNFTNHDSEIELKKYLSQIDLDCGKTYYFVFKHTNNGEILKPFYFQFSFSDDILDSIDISSLFLKSRYLTFLKRTEKEEKYIYSSNENKNVLITFSKDSNLSIINDNNQTIYEIKADTSMAKLFEFKSGQKYNINYNVKTTSFISFEIYNESYIFKHDFKDGPIRLTGYNYNYYFEIDISNYNKDEYILFSLYNVLNYMFVKYQFKKSDSDFKENNLISLGEYNKDNFIPIKKENEEDSSLILFVKPIIYNNFALIDLYKYKSYEIDSESKKIKEGPCLFFVDYFKFNNLNSFGIQSNQKYIFYEQQITNEIRTFTGKYENVSIITNNYLNTKTYRKAFILINSTGDISFEVKKFNFPIIYSELNGMYSNKKEFFQLSRRENTLKELYFHLNNNSPNYYEIFLPVFGNFNSSFINLNEIHDLSDFNFNENKDNIFILEPDKKGYLKIQCEEEAMLSHFSINSPTKNLTSGKRFYFTGDYLDNKYGLDIKLINKTIPLKINTFGLDTNDKIIFKIEDIYIDSELNNGTLEMNYTYNGYNSELIEFTIDEKIKGKVLIELIVGFIEDDLNFYEQLDFENSVGTIEIEKNKGTIIKVPKDFSDTLIDYSIIFPKERNFDVQIKFDNIIYAVSSGNNVDDLFPIIPLFKFNPYSKISDNLNENKYFFITIYNKENKEKIFIKKPKLFSEFELNKINILPALNGENSKYYHQFKIREKDDNYLYLQTLNETKYLSVSHSSIHYIFPSLYTTDINDIPLIKNNNLEYINYYNTEYDVIINIASSKDFLIRNKNNYILLKPEIEQIKNSNKIKIKMNSLSYHFYPYQYQYYFITNSDNSNFNPYFALQFICGKKKLDKSLRQTMINFEDDGQNKIIEKEIELDIEVNETFSNNKMTIAPVIKKYKLLDTSFGTSLFFDFIYQKESKEPPKKQEKKKWPIVLAIVSAVIVLLIIGFIIYIKRRRKNSNKNSIENIENDILSQELK